MEATVNQAFQTVRRAGKRFVVFKANSSNRNKNQTQQQQQQQTNNILIHHFRNQPSFLSKYTQRITLISEVSPTFFLHNSKQIAYHKKSTSKLLNTSCRCLHTLSNASLLNPSEVEEFLEKNRISYKKGYTGFLAGCKRCDCNENNHNYNVFIDNRTGQATCRSCGLKQKWKTFRENYSGKEVVTAQPETDRVIVYVKESPENHIYWKDSELISEVNSSVTILQDIFIETLQTFHVRITPDNIILFPCYDITKKNLLELKAYDENGDEVATVTASESPVIFGYHTITENDKKIVLTSNVLDSIVVTQITGFPSLAVPKSSFSSHMFPFLERFSEIILWFRDDYREQENLQTFAKKLDLQRCWKVSSPKTARFLWKQNGAQAVLETLRGSHRMAHDHILTYKDLQTELFYHLINAKKNAGVPFTRFPSLNEYLKGHRRGELTVFTGPTGSGKTTFLSELSLDLCMQGVKTLWGSFEIKNLRLLNTLMHQFTGFSLENHIDQFLNWSEKFESLPLYFMNYYGAQNLHDVIRTIEYAVYMYNIEHVIIDNLQFMITTLGSSDDKFQAMDRAISAFRKCASDHNIHVTVVVHPRKENDGGSLQTASIYGSAKASQEADNVLILQTSDQLSMQVTKNRFCGSIGILPLSFHPESLCLSGFHRNVDTGEAILPQLRIRRPVRNIQILRKGAKE